MAGIREDPERFYAVRTKQHFEEKLRQRSKEKELKKEIKKKKKARPPVSVVACDAPELVVKEKSFPEKKASDGVRGKVSASKPMRRLTQEILLPLLRRRVTPVFTGECHPRAAGRGPPRRPAAAASAQAASVSRGDSASPNLCPDDSGCDSGNGDPISWDDLKNVLERVRRDSLQEGWGNLEDEYSEDDRDQANGESLDESWNNLGDALEQAKRETLRLFQSYDRSLPEA